MHRDQRRSSRYDHEPGRGPTTFGQPSGKRSTAATVRGWTSTIRSTANPASAKASTTGAQRASPEVLGHHDAGLVPSVAPLSSRCRRPAPLVWGGGIAGRVVRGAAGTTQPSGRSTEANDASGTDQSSR